MAVIHKDRMSQCESRGVHQNNKIELATFLLTHILTKNTFS